VQIDIINTVVKFKKLKKNWVEVYSVDKDSTVQRSWSWMKGWIECTQLDWFLLAAKKTGNAHYVGFMMLAYDKSRQGSKKIYIGGHPWAARTGVICLPEYENKTLKIFANYLKSELAWNVLDLSDTYDAKIIKLLNYFPKFKFHIKQKKNTSCPELELVNDWDSYVREYLSTSKAKKLRYYLRRVEKELDYRIVRISDGNFENDITILLELWQSRFGKRTEEDLHQIKTLFKVCSVENAFWYELIFDGDVAVAGLAAFTDEIKGCFSPFIIVHNEKYSKYSLGKVIVANSLQYVFDKKYMVYDFGRGDSEYKSWFGAISRENNNYVINRMTTGAIVKAPIKKIASLFASSEKFMGSFRDR